MGRGRAKAKQTKVARELKYFSPDTDLSALERELHQSRGGSFDPERVSADEVDEDDVVEDLDEGDEDGDHLSDYERWASGSDR